MAKNFFGEHSMRSLISLIKGDFNTVNTKTSELDGKVATLETGKTTSDGKITTLEGKVTTLEEGKTTADGKITTLEGKVTTLETNTQGINDKIGAVNGIAPLDASGKVASDYLPSYVDDVIEGYMVSATTRASSSEPGGEDEGTTITFYEDEAHTTAITGERGKIYLDLHTNSSWRFGGSTYTKIVSDDLVEFTEDEITTMWNSITV